MRIAHLLASPFFGGPERQVLGFTQHLPPSCQSLFLSFSERGQARDFLRRAHEAGYESRELRTNWPRALAAVNEVVRNLRQWRADILITSGYKPDLIGYFAARRLHIPLLSIAHGWTGATWKVRLNEAMDRRVLRRFDCVVGVSHAQTEKNRAAGIPLERTRTISNAVDPARCHLRSEIDRRILESFFDTPPEVIVAAAGRLSPEKGFEVLVDAAARIAAEHPAVGFIVFGEGNQRPALENLIRARRLTERFVLGGFRNDLDRLLPQADLLALSSYTEGLPVIALEGMAAGLPVVATAVGGLPELIASGEEGFLVPPGDSEALAQAISRLVADSSLRQRMGAAAACRIAQSYTCQQQALEYFELARELIASRRGTSGDRAELQSVGPAPMTRPGGPS